MIEKTIETAFNEALNRRVETNHEVWVTELSDCLRKSFYRRKYGYRVTKEMLAGACIHAELLETVA